MDGKILGVERRRRWSKGEKARIVEETLMPGGVINDAYQQRKVGASLLALRKFPFDKLELPALTRDRPTGLEYGFRHDEDPDVDRCRMASRTSSPKPSGRRRF